MTPYRNPYLVQRISRAQLNDGLPPGLAAKYQAGEPRSKQERDFINALMPLDYMGSAEFEFGAFGRAVVTIVSNRADFVRFKLMVRGKPDTWLYRGFSVTETDVQLFGFAHRDHIEQAKADILRFVTDTYPHRTKEAVRLNQVFGVVRETYYDDKGRRLHKSRVALEPPDITAWLDLENGWMVGSSAYQMDTIAELFGIPAK